MKTAINISLQIKDRELDVRIPNQVTLERLESLLIPILQEEGLLRSEKLKLTIKNKKIVIDSQQTLAEYSLSDGDCFEVSFI